jgi:hypothetical protein
MAMVKYIFKNAGGGVERECEYVSVIAERDLNLRDRWVIMYSRSALGWLSNRDCFFGCNKQGEDLEMKLIISQ